MHVLSKKKDSLDAYWRWDDINEAAQVEFIPSPVLGPRKGPLSRALRLVAYNNTATHLNPPLEYYELKDN